MPNMPPTFRPSAAPSKVERRREHDQRRGSSAERGYGSKWRKARAEFLHANPLCVMCERQGRLTPAKVVDHIKPHRGDLGLFWSRSNWQPLCKPCHDSDKQREERAAK